MLLAAALLASGCRNAEPERRADAKPDLVRGRALLVATRDSLPQHVGNGLRCTSCHLGDGRQANAMPWIGVTVRYPQYRSRAGAEITIEDRINECFERSMNGSKLAESSRDMLDMVAYLAFLSRGAPPGGEVHGEGLPVMTPLVADKRRGAAVFASRCVSCHGVHGDGSARAPALWGPQSYNIGAGMARLRTAASFIHANMPLGNASLTEQQAFDVAAYVNAQPRPDYAPKAKDWPHGDAPPDVPYRTDASVRAESGTGAH